MWGGVGRGRCGEMWGDVAISSTTTIRARTRREMWGDAGRCGEMRGDVGRCGEMWGDSADAPRASVASARHSAGRPRRERRAPPCRGPRSAAARRRRSCRSSGRAAEEGRVAPFRGVGEQPLRLRPRESSREWPRVAESGRERPRVVSPPPPSSHSRAAPGRGGAAAGRGGSQRRPRTSRPPGGGMGRSGEIWGDLGRSSSTSRQPPSARRAAPINYYIVA